MPTGNDFGMRARSPIIYKGIKNIDTALISKTFVNVVAIRQHFTGHSDDVLPQVAREDFCGYDFAETNGMVCCSTAQTEFQPNSVGEGLVKFSKIASA